MVRYQQNAFSSLIISLLTLSLGLLTMTPSAKHSEVIRRDKHPIDVVAPVGESIGTYDRLVVIDRGMFFGNDGFTTYTDIGAGISSSLQSLLAHWRPEPLLPDCRY